MTKGEIRVNEMRIPVIHFIGCGRSGTTILNIVLDNHPEIVGIGELTYFTRHTWKKGGYCSCGNKIQDCKFWSEVFSKWVSHSDADILDEYISLQNKFERYRQLPRVFLERVIRSKDFQRYSKYTYLLYKSINAVSGAKYIADASKNPIRVLALLENPAIDLYIVHLTRNVMGVASSNKKLFGKDFRAGLGWDVKPVPPWKSTLNWVSLNIFSDLICNTYTQSLLLKYEDLITRTKWSLDKLSEFLDLEFTEVAQVIRNKEPLSINHLCAGNRLRMKDSIVLETELTQNGGLSENEIKTVWRLSSPIMKRYGYKI